jgi:hypothetical protein
MALQSPFIIVETYTKSGEDPAYQWPAFKSTAQLRLVKPLVSVIHCCMIKSNRTACCRTLPVS